MKIPFIFSLHFMLFLSSPAYSTVSMQRTNRINLLSHLRKNPIFYSDYADCKCRSARDDLLRRQSIPHSRLNAFGAAYGDFNGFFRNSGGSDSQISLQNIQKKKKRAGSLSFPPLNLISAGFAGSFGE